MTEKANPSPNRPADAFSTAGAIAYGGSVDGFIVDSASPTDIATQDTDIDETQFNNFAATTSTTSLTVNIAPGEGFVFGSWLAIDTQSSVTLNSSTAGQTVYLGWDKNTSNAVIIGTDSAFATTASDTDQRIPLFDFDTDGSGVTATTDRRQIGRAQDLAVLSVADELGVPVYADSTNAPQTEGRVIAIDGSGSQSAGLYSHDGNSYVKAGKTAETIEDTVTAMLTAGADIDINYDDANDTLTINNTAGYTDEDAQDATASALAAGTNISITYDDPNDTITVDTSALDSEQVEDQVNSLLDGGTGINTTYDDGNDTLSISGFDGDHTSLSNVLSDQHHTRYSNEEAQDAIASALAAGTNISITYDDSNDTITVDTSALDSEQVEDQVNSLLSSGTNINLAYDDANNDLTISLSSAVSADSDLTSADWGDYEIQKNGTDGSGIINFKT